MTMPGNFVRALIVIGTLGCSAPALAETVCLRKAPDPQVKTTGELRAGVVTSDQDVATYLAKGFVTVPCPSVESLARYRDTICNAAKRGNSSVQVQLEQALGEKPAKICAAARLVVTIAAPPVVPQPAPSRRPAPATGQN